MGDENSLNLDKSLLALINNEPDKGLEKLMNLYAGFVYAIVFNKLSIVCTKYDIEECVSDVFLSFFNNKSAIDLNKGSIKSYLAVISKRKAVDVYRRHVRKSNLSTVNSEELTVIADDKRDTEQILIAKETKKELLFEIKNMGVPDTEIFIRKFFIGQSTKEISKALKMKANTIDKRISRGLVKLRRSLGGARNG